ncbi:MAG: hypothetical protein JW741_12680 [Sedimentisphaerales bacterium]|nr:hypothetical protein [Sedimentisphaerales bacterium]
MKPGITLLFRSFVLLLFTHAAIVQSRDTMLRGIFGEVPLVAMAVVAGLAGVAFGYSGALALDRYLQRLLADEQDRDATSEDA